MFVQSWLFTQNPYFDALNVAFAGTAILATMISVIPSVTAAFNALGRIGYSNNELHHQQYIHLYIDDIFVRLVYILLVTEVKQLNWYT